MVGTVFKIDKTCVLFHCKVRTRQFSHAGLIRVVTLGEVCFLAQTCQLKNTSKNEYMIS